MAMSVNTNVTSLFAQNQLNQSQNSLQTTLQRLSSGLRINTAADDASGYAISNRMNSIVSGLATSMRNANDGISYSQTVSQALSTMTDNLQRMRELAVQSLNGVYSNDDKTLLSQEYNQLLMENSRIQATTTFNGVKVFNPVNVSFQVGYRNNIQDRVQTGVIDLTKVTAVNLTGIVDTNTSTAASDIGTTINRAINAIDGAGNSTATYTNVASSVSYAIESSTKLDNFQKDELMTLVGNLASYDQSINRGITNFGSDLNKLMGSTIAYVPVTPQKVVNVTLASSALSAIQSPVANSAAISATITKVNAASTIASAYSLASGIAANPSFSPSVSTEIANDITTIYNQYKNNPNTTFAKSSFTTAIDNLFNSGTSYSTTFIGVSVPTTLDPIDQGIVAADSGILAAQNDLTKTTISSIATNVLNATSVAQGLGNLTTTQADGFTNAVNDLLTYATSSNSGMSVTDFRNAINSIRTGGTFSIPSVTTALSNSAKNAISSGTANLQSYLDNMITSAAITSGLSYSMIQTTVNNGINTLYNSGLISSSVQTSLTTAVNSLYSAESYPAGSNMTTSQFALDLKTLMGNSATGSITPGTPLTTQFNTSIGSYSQLIKVPIWISSVKNASDAINTIDLALTQLNEENAQQGALQNRLASIIASQTSFQISQTSASSRITDLDFSTETTNLTKEKILQTAGSAMLVQANASSKAVLKLLR